MGVEKLPDSLKAIVNSMRSEIRQGNVKREGESGAFWRYGGNGFVALKNSLESELAKEIEPHGMQVNMSCHSVVNSPLILQGVGMRRATF